MENIKRYKGEYNLDLIYKWDNNGSLDDIIEGWIPKELIEILFEFQIKRNRNIIKKLLMEWARKINDIIYNDFWKSRNEAMHHWEKENNINFMKKRNKKGGNKKLARENLKRKISGKKDNYEHVVDENRYLMVARKIGFGFS